MRKPIVEVSLFFVFFLVLKKAQHSNFENSVAKVAHLDNLHLIVPMSSGYCHGALAPLQSQLANIQEHKRHVHSFIHQFFVPFVNSVRKCLEDKSIFLKFVLTTKSSK